MNQLVTFTSHILLLTLILCNFLDNVCSEVYQPTQQEIERFKLIQEQIKAHQQEYLKQKQAEKEEQLRKEIEEQQTQARIPDPFLFPHSVPMVPLLYSKHLPEVKQRPTGALTNLGPVPPLIGHQVHATAVMQNQPQPQHHSHNVMAPLAQHPHSTALAHNTALLQELNLNPHYKEVRQFSSLTQPHTHAHSKLSEDKKSFDEDYELIHNNKHHHDTTEEADRHDKHYDKHEGTRSFGPPYRCYACQWNIAQCSDFNCYNNPDHCTNNNFNAHMIHQADCPGGCEQFVVTDPNGLVQQWKRGCAPPSLPIKRMRCQSHYEFGIRVDHCICNTDWCNHATTPTHTPVLLIVLLLVYLYHL